LDGKGNRDLMLNGKNGYIFQEENSEQFVETIIELFDDQKKYLEISSFAKEFSSQFDIKNYVEKLVHLYESKCSTSNNSILKNAS
jgi:glycosyltransferase involved in cell wall biosynthesis